MSSCGKRVPVFGELLEHARIGGRARRRPLEHREARASRTGSARSCGLELMLNSVPAAGVDLLLDTLPLARESLLERREPVGVDRDAAHSMSASTSTSGISMSLNSAQSCVRLELRLEDRAQLERHVRIFARVVARSSIGTRRTGPLPFPCRTDPRTTSSCGRETRARARSSPCERRPGSST